MMCLVGAKVRRQVQVCGMIGALAFGTAVKAQTLEESSEQGTWQATRREIMVNPDSLLSREEWQMRISKARARAEQARRDWSLLPHEPPFSDPKALERAATERVLNDDTLEPGDIVATNRGLLVYRAQDGQQRAFVPFTPR